MSLQFIRSIAQFEIKKKEYLEAAFDEMQTKYGSIEKYFSDALGAPSADECRARAERAERETRGALAREQAAQN